ncbi:hypothetical protein [Algoriphagus boritolerans]|uniref:hypothetical protein n=1 Tax=Algoriphagus boritolerans TaxID=308111 RepID=UPI002FCDF0AD
MWQSISIQKNAGIELNIQQLTLGFRQLNANEQLNQTELTYLKMPLLASFFCRKVGEVSDQVWTASGFFLLQAKDISRQFDGLNPPELPTYGGSGDNPNRFMYGMTAGAGISKLFGKSTISGEVRFAYDFTNPEAQDRIYDMNSTNLEFTLAYLFRIREPKF